MSKQNNPEGGIWNLVLIVTLLLGMRMVFFRSGVEIPEHLKAMIVEMMLAAAFLLVALKKEQQRRSHLTNGPPESDSLPRHDRSTLGYSLACWLHKSVGELGHLSCEGDQLWLAPIRTHDLDSQRQAFLAKPERDLQRGMS